MDINIILKVLEMAGYASAFVDTMLDNGNIVSLSFPLEVTVPAGQTLSFAIPLEKYWLCIMDWCDIDMDGVGKVVITYERDGIQSWKFSRPIRTVPIDEPAYSSVVLSITNNDTVDHFVSILWHYTVALANRYNSFVSGVGSFVSRVIKEVAEHGIQVQ